MFDILPKTLCITVNTLTRANALRIVVPPVGGLFVIRIVFSFYFIFVLIPLQSVALDIQKPVPMVQDIESNPVLSEAKFNSLNSEMSDVSGMTITPVMTASQSINPSDSKLPHKAVVLVPGFFSSIVPFFQKQNSFIVSPYWSDTIISVFQQAGYTVFVVNNLNPIGSIEENGFRLMTFMSGVEKYYAQKKITAQYYFVGHSAGGLYSLYALSQYTRLNSPLAHAIKKIISVSTPFGGASVLDDLYARLSFVGDFIKWVSLSSLKELSRAKVENFLSKVRVPADLQYYSFASYQAASRDWSDAHYLSWPFYISGMFIQSISDGLISYESSLSSRDHVITIGNGRLPIQTFPQEFINLDHGKQVLDFRAFKVLGVKNVEVIRDEQIRFYNRITQIIK